LVKVISEGRNPVYKKREDENDKNHAKLQESLKIFCYDYSGSAAAGGWMD
jgi:hypothetical protein